MSGRQVIGLVIVAAALAGYYLLPGSEERRETSSAPTHGCEHARGEAHVEPTLCLLNAERERHGLPPLRPNRRLERAAQRHALDMAERDYFEHRSPDGTGPHERILRAGYRDARLTGENLAQGELEAGAPAAIVDGWMHSPGHRENILRRGFEEIGLAVVRDGDLAIYVTTFGARR